MGEQTIRTSGEVEPGRRVADPHVHLIPRPFWWLKRLVVLAGFLLVGLVCLRWWWGFEAHRRLQAEIERYRSAGQPVYADDFNVEVEDEQNAAVLLQKATEAINSTTDTGLTLRVLCQQPKACAEAFSEVGELVQSNGLALDLVRQARARPKVAWSLTGVTQASFNAVIGTMSARRQLARVLWISAFYCYCTGNHYEAVETLHDLLAYSEAVDSQPTLIATLVAGANYDMLFSLIRDMGPSLSVETAVVARANGTRPATREQVEGLLRRLLDEDAYREALVRAFYADRAYQLDMLTWLRQGGPGMPRPPLSGRVTDLLHEPLVTLDTVRAMRHCTVISEAAAEASWPAAMARVPVKPESPSLLHTLTRFLSETSFESASGAIKIHFRNLARRRMAATALAIRLYEVDHGRKPDHLRELLPRYLAEVPVDPFSAEGDSIRYKPDAKRPLLHSVGPSGRDDGGGTEARVDGRPDLEKGDLLFYVDGSFEDVNEVPITSGASLQTDEHDEDGEDDERQTNERQAGDEKP